MLSLDNISQYCIEICFQICNYFGSLYFQPQWQTVYRVGSSTGIDLYQTLTSADVYDPEVLKSLPVTSTDKTLYKTYAATSTRWTNIEKVNELCSPVITRLERLWHRLIDQLN